nr:probable E3 ubiquitin ligase SUD1 isoform X2 [Ipomoea batatas]
MRILHFVSFTEATTRLLRLSPRIVSSSSWSSFVNSLSKVLISSLFVFFNWSRSLKSSNRELVNLLFAPFNRSSWSIFMESVGESMSIVRINSTSVAITVIRADPRKARAQSSLILRPHNSSWRRTMKKSWSMWSRSINLCCYQVMMIIDFAKYWLRCQLQGHEDDVRGVLCDSVGIAVGSLEAGPSRPKEEPEVTEEFSDVEWSDLIESQLEELILSNLDAIFRSAIKKIVACTCSNEIANKAVLRNDQEFDIHVEHYFNNLQQMEKYVLAELVCLLQEVKPVFSTGPFTEIPADMLLFQICIPFAIEHIKLLTTIKCLLRYWFTVVGWSLGLIEFLLPRPEDNSGQENGNGDQGRQNRVWLCASNSVAAGCGLDDFAYIQLCPDNCISLGRALFNSLPLLSITHGIKCNDLYAFVVEALQCQVDYPSFEAMREQHAI